jgi:hypothetical protein
MEIGGSKECTDSKIAQIPSDNAAYKKEVTEQEDASQRTDAVQTYLQKRCDVGDGAGVSGCRQTAL